MSWLLVAFFFLSGSLVLFFTLMLIAAMVASVFSWLRERAWRRPRIEVIEPTEREAALSAAGFIYRVIYKDDEGKEVSTIHLFPHDSPCEEERRRWIIREIMKRGCHVTKITKLEKNEVNP